MWSVAAVLLACLAAPALASEVTPVQKVIAMLEEMKQKGIKEKNEEATQYAAYKTWCSSTIGEKTRNIAAGKESIVQLKAGIEKAGADAMVAASDLEELTANLDDLSAQKAEALKIRAADHADFSAVHADYTAAIDAVGRALQVLKASPGQLLQTKQSLQQMKDLTALPDTSKAAITAFLQKWNGLKQDQDPTEAMLEESILSDQPKPKTYESSSGGVIDMVKDLGSKFKSERYELEKKEAKSQHASDMIVQELTDNIERATKESNEKSSFKAARETYKAEAEGDLADTTTTLGEDMKFLADTSTTCTQKAEDFENRQTLRQEEIEAVQKAIDIMSSDDVAGGTQHLPSLVQRMTGQALAQLRADGQSPIQSRVARFLDDCAERQNSRILALVATRVAADPFKKIKKMIQDMVVKLTEEANEEAEHKEFCDTEMGTNKATRDTKTEEADTLKATIEETSAAISKLAGEITDLSDAIAAGDAAVAKATAERMEEKAKNTATIADAKVAKEATQRALSVLRTFYDKASKATALLMVGAKQPATFNKPYTGMGGSSTGVVGMLEVIESDFVRLEEETTTGESTAAREYDQFMSDSSEDKSTKETSVKHKTKAKTEKERTLSRAEKDLKETQSELDAAMEYFEKLKPSCVQAGNSYEERVANRKAEIESLQDAMKILSGEDLA